MSTTIQPNKLAKIATLMAQVSTYINLSKLVDTAKLTVAEQIGTTPATGICSLFPAGTLSDKEQEHLDRELVYMVQNLMASKIESAVTEMEVLGATIDERLYSDYTQLPEDRL